MSKIRILAAILMISFCVMAHGQENGTTPEGTVLQPEPSGMEVSENAVPPDGYSAYSRLGIGLGADAAYRKNKGFSMNGYVDSVYENFASDTNIGTPSNLNQEMGLVRGTGFFGYRISDRIVVNSEIAWSRDLEDSRTGKATVDLAYVDYFLRDNMVLRGGILLVPMGLVNEFHRPDEVLGTRRALGDIETIPTTWHAAGFGIAGFTKKIDYRAYVLSGLDAAGFTVHGTRNTRETNWDTLQTPAFVFRIDGHLFRGGILGASFYVGDAGVVDGPVPSDLKVRVFTQEIHMQARGRGAIIRAQYVKTELNNTRNLNILMGTQGFDGIGSRFVGGYVEGGYNIMEDTGSSISIMPFLRVEETNPQDALPQSSIDIGLRKNLTVDHFVYTYGVEIRPINNLLIKIDTQMVKAEKVDVGVNQFSIGLSYIF
jgi:hypothetical protein